MASTASICNSKGTHLIIEGFHFRGDAIHIHPIGRKGDLTRNHKGDFLEVLPFLPDFRAASSPPAASSLCRSHLPHPRHIFPPASNSRES